MLGILSWLCFPIYLIQGLYVRKKSIRLPPAKGAKSGLINAGTSRARPIKILCLGDSGIAGVGCADTSETLTPKLAAELSKALKKPVEWHMNGNNSAVAGEILNSVVPNLEHCDYDHIYISIGANDSKNWHTKSRFKQEFGNLIYALHARFPTAKLYWSPHAPYSKFPLLPKPLNFILEWRAQILGKQAYHLCIERDVNFIPRMENITQDGFVEDGFHPNAKANQGWAEHLAKQIVA
jgi:lysophospholipase L1-like esterase